MSDKKKLVQLMEEHDWYYQYADDFRYWKAGSEQIDEIHELIRKIGKEEGVKIFNENCPEGHQIDIELYHC